MKKYYLLVMMMLMSMMMLAGESPKQNKTISKSSKTANYCVPNVSDPEAITFVSLGTISNRTPAVTNLGYEDFTNMSALIGQGKTYQIKVQGNTDGNYLASYTLFIDFNQDGILGPIDNNDTAGEKERFELGYLQNSNGNDGKELIVNITIPYTAKLGNTRMRLMKRQTTAVPITYATSGCVLGNTYGQVEDYTLNIFKPVGCTTTVNGANLSSYFVPKNIDAEQLITNSAKTGAYTDIFVTEGVQYKFKLDKSGVFSTLGDDKGAVFITSSLSEFDWTSTITGVLRWYTHADEATCAVDNSIFSQIIVASVINNPIKEACSVGITGSKGFLTADNAGVNLQELAIDLPIYGGKRSKIKTITLNLAGDATFINFVEMSDNNGLPGATISSIQTTINSKTLAYTQNGKTFYSYKVSFLQPILTDDSQGNRKWLKLVTDATGAELSSNFKIGKGIAIKNNTNNAWQVDDSRELVYQVEADCTQEMCNQVVITTDIPGDELVTDGAFVPYGYGEITNLIDIVVDPGKQLKVKGIELDFWSTHPIADTVDAKKVEFNLRANKAADNTPGAIIKTNIANALTREKLEEVVADDPPTTMITRYKVTANFNEPIVLDAAESTKFWLEINSDYAVGAADANLSAFVGEPSYLYFGPYDMFIPNDSELVYKLITDCATLETQNSIKQENTKVYPVPFNNTLTISSPVIIKTVELFNMAGAKALQKEINQSKVELDLSRLPVGVYILRTVDVNAKVEAQKVIKK